MPCLVRLWVWIIVGLISDKAGVLQPVGPGRPVREIQRQVLRQDTVCFPVITSVGDVGGGPNTMPPQQNLWVGIEAVTDPGLRFPPDSAISVDFRAPVVLSISLLRECLPPRYRPRCRSNCVFRGFPRLALEHRSYALENPPTHSAKEP